MKVIINDKEFEIPEEVGKLVKECQEYRNIGEGRSPEELLNYIKKLNKKYYELMKASAPESE